MCLPKLSTPTVKCNQTHSHLNGQFLAEYSNTLLTALYAPFSERAITMSFMLYACNSYTVYLKRKSR